MERKYKKYNDVVESSGKLQKAKYKYIYFNKKIINGLQLFTSEIKNQFVWGIHFQAN